MNKTQIEWVKNPDGTQGYTWNPITGCLNGCPYCYARRLANGRLRQRYLANSRMAVNKLGLAEFEQAIQDPFYPRFWENRLREQFGAYTAGAEPKGIFVCDMGDLFGIGVPEHWTERVLDKIGRSWYREHRFYLLTKQPQNLAKWSLFPPNCWVGVTATSAKTGQGGLYNAEEYLMQIEAKVKYISLEPLLQWDGAGKYVIQRGADGGWIDWLIIGAQTKPYKPPKIERVEEIVRAADQAGIPVFLKDNLRPLLVDALAKKLINRQRFFVKGEGYGWNLRQEMPI